MTMSHIPSSAMPHAGPSEAVQNGRNDQADHADQQAGGGIGATIGGGAGKIADYARENPKTAAAAGAAIVAGIAAAAIPLVRGRKAGQETASESSSGAKSKKKA